MVKWGWRPLAALVVCLTGVLLVSSCASDGDDADDDVDRTTTTAVGSDDTAPEEDTGGTISVLAYNVAGLPQEISKVTPTVHIPMISPLLEPYDIVLTQEDFDWWQPVLDSFDFASYHEQLRAETTHEYATAQHPGPEAVGLDPTSRPLQLGDGQGILSRFPFTDETRVPWEGCFGGADTSDNGAADCLAMKGFAVVRMTLAPDVEVDVYTLHVEAGGTEEDQRLQAADMAQLADFIAEFSDGRAIILGGDTNLHTGDEDDPKSEPEDVAIWNRFLADTGLIDVCDALDCPEPGRIDKMTYRSSGDVEFTPVSWKFEVETFVGPEGEPLSDHDPLHVEFDWGVPSGGQSPL